MRRLLPIAILALATFAGAPSRAATVITCGDPNLKIRNSTLAVVQHDGTSGCIVEFTVTSQTSATVHFDLLKLEAGVVDVAIPAGQGGKHPCPETEDNSLGNCYASASNIAHTNDSADVHWPVLRPGTFKFTASVNGVGGWAVTFTVA